MYERTMFVKKSESWKTKNCDFKKKVFFLLLFNKALNQPHKPTLELTSQGQHQV